MSQGHNCKVHPREGSEFIHIQVNMYRNRKESESGGNTTQTPLGAGSKAGGTKMVIRRSGHLPRRTVNARRQAGTRGCT